MTANTVDAPVTRISLIKRFDLFHFLSLSAGLADIKVLASKICLS
jgi:hypothetical protein